ncbi:MAG: Wzz/FepE/Etk N-terminal domain-containing protein, partial [Flavobacteriales bacterium]
MKEEKGLIEVFKIAKQVVVRKKIQLIIASVIGGILGVLYSVFLASNIYTSNISFTLEQKGSSMGSLGGLASSLGLGDLPTTNSTGMFGGENILHLIKSNRIIHESLKENQYDLAGDNLLNLYIKSHFKSQLKKKKIKLFPKNVLNKRFNREQDSILLLITKNIRENQIKVERVDKKTTIINLDVDDSNEKWAFLFSKALVKNAIELYLDIKVGKLLRTEQELTQKKDSIRGLLNGSITTLAYETDLNSHTPLMRYKTNQAKKQIDVEVLKNM